MKSIVCTTLLCSALVFAAGSAAAQDAMKKTEPMAGDTMGMKKQEMSMQDCKDHMAMKTAAGMKKDDATMKKGASCAAMVKKEDAMAHKDGMAKDGMMKKDEMKKEEMKK